ncbi:MAG: hypothetical protein FJ029_00285, partial [Actinobacteria bacterium]|nr:hypothetical protein [Actinomycetota bacterium]
MSGSSDRSDTRATEPSPRRGGSRTAPTPSSHLHARDVYLEDIALDEAVHRFHTALAAAGALTPLPAEDVALTEALGRITAEPVWAKLSSPHYHAAAMDGAAVLASATVGATETAPRALRLGAEAVWVDTGDPVPPGMDAVVMIEHIHDRGDGAIEVLAAVAPWQHVRPLGEDIVATELVLPAGHRIRPVDL